jgi:hypothetical protein
VFGKPTTLKDAAGGTQSYSVRHLCDVGPRPSIGEG